MLDHGDHGHVRDRIRGVGGMQEVDKGVSHTVYTVQVHQVAIAMSASPDSAPEPKTLIAEPLSKTLNPKP